MSKEDDKYSLLIKFIDNQTDELKIDEGIIYYYHTCDPILKDKIVSNMVSLEMVDKKKWLKKLAGEMNNRDMINYITLGTVSNISDGLIRIIV